MSVDFKNATINNVSQISANTSTTGVKINIPGTYNDFITTQLVSSRPQLTFQNQIVSNLTETGRFWFESLGTFAVENRARFVISPWSTSQGISVLTSSTAGAPALQPLLDNSMRLGNTSFRWTTVYATTGTINTSDRNQKENIEVSDLGLDFIKDLTPVKYKWIDIKPQGEIDMHIHKRKHYGLIAQDVLEVLNKNGISTNDFAGYIEDKDEKENITYGLRYTEFISPMIKAIQELSEKVEALDTRIKQLESK